jgi:hypothetical protein
MTEILLQKERKHISFDSPPGVGLTPESEKWIIYLSYEDRDPENRN